VTPGVEPDTHQHIRTGQHDSKFGLLLEDVPELAQWIVSNPRTMKFLGLHAHIGSQGQDLAPYLLVVDVLADLVLELKQQHSIDISYLDLGGGLGITYSEQDKPIAIHEWAQAMADRTKTAFSAKGLPLPVLMLEPGRSIVGTAGVTLYRAGHSKVMGGQTSYLALDGGMADNPRPITYQARYTACVANRMNAGPPQTPVTLAGRYCESGDIIIREAYLSAESGDLIAIFGTGAYNYSMASNYNRTQRPACVLVANGAADIIIERESIEDLLRQDRIPHRLT
jgi:diaminopimelate decarboxylase